MTSMNTYFIVFFSKTSGYLGPVLGCTPVHLEHIFHSKPGCPVPMELNRKFTENCWEASDSPHLGNWFAHEAWHKSGKRKPEGWTMIKVPLKHGRKSPGNGNRRTRNPQEPSIVESYSHFSCWISRDAPTHWLHNYFSLRSFWNDILSACWCPYTHDLMPVW